MPFDLDDCKRDRLNELRSRLLSPPPEPAALAQLIHVASIITDAFTAVGLRPPTVVGGLAVEIYTNGDYTTRDVDFVHSDLRASGKLMRALGFSRRVGDRYYVHPSLDVAVEFPDSELDGSPDRVAEIEVDASRKVFVIGIEDIVLDRVAAYLNWDKCNEDSEHAVQAITLLIAQRDRIDEAYLQRTARERGWADALAEIKTRADAVREEWR